MNPTEDLPITPFYGLSLYSGSLSVLLNFCSERTEKREFVSIFTPNPEQLVLAQANPAFRRTLSRGSVLLPDGQGLAWAAKIAQRLAGREVFHELLKLAVKNDWKVFLLGGKPGSAQKVIKKWKMENGKWEFDDGPKTDTQEALKKIQQFRPGLVFVAYGAPWQEEWVVTHTQELKDAGVRIAMVVGGAFEYEAGVVPSVPKAFESAGLEWLWRLLTEPWRWRRQLKGLLFFWWVLMGKYNS